MNKRYFLPVFLFLFCLPMIFHANPSIKKNGFIEDWLVLGPVSVFEDGASSEDETLQKSAFDADILNPNELTKIKKGTSLKVKNASMKWQEVSTEKGLLDLDELYDGEDFVYAYALAKLDMVEAKNVLLGIGSDDGVKVWLNGEMVHEHWIGRAHSFNEDIVPVQFKKGKNLLLIKVQDMEMDWAMSCKILGEEDLQDMLVKAGRAGHIDQLELLLENGAEINAISGSGLTALHAAKVKGRQETIDFLLKSGADSSIPMPSKEKIIDWMFEDVEDGMNPGCAVLVARDGKIEFQKGYGYANIKKKVKVTPSTTFRIGSVSKQFTASAILKLMEEGKLKLDDPLSKYIQDFPRGDEVTIHHLLTHISGIHSYTNDPNFMDGVEQYISPKDLVKKIKTFDYEFDPGAAWNYNNSGYFLLGYIVEQISEKSFGEYLQQELFKPLKMSSTGAYENQKSYSNEAIGYSFEEGEVKVALDWDMSWAGGAGVLYSTVKDLYRWNENVFNGKVLEKESLNKAFTPANLNNGTQANAMGGTYGYGWMMSSFRGSEVIAHGGGLHGFNTYLGRFPEQNMTVAVVYNCVPNQYVNTGAFGMEIAELFLWEDLDEQSSFSMKKDVDTGNYDEYAGLYEYPGGVIMTISKEGYQLYAQMPGQQKFEIFPKTEDEFFWKVVDAQIKFFRDENGKVTHGEHTQGGQTSKVPRYVQENEAEIDVSVYEKYVGEYSLGPATLSITNENGQLFVKTTGQPKFELFPRSETVFFLKVVKANITFLKDENGQVNALELDQAGMKMKAERKR